MYYFLPMEIIKRIQFIQKYNKTLTTAVKSLAAFDLDPAMSFDKINVNECVRTT